MLLHRLRRKPAGVAVGLEPVRVPHRHGATVGVGYHERVGRVGAREQVQERCHAAAAASAASAAAKGVAPAVPRRCPAHGGEVGGAHDLVRVEVEHVELGRVEEQEQVRRVRRVGDVDAATPRGSAGDSVLGRLHERPLRGHVLQEVNPPASQPRGAAVGPQGRPQSA